MFNLKTSLDLLESDMWMASADLTNSYYSVQINLDQGKLLGTIHCGQYQVLPTGYPQRHEPS